MDGGGFDSGYSWRLILHAGMYVCGGIIGHSGLLDHKRVPTVLPKHILGGGGGGEAGHNAGSVRESEGTNIALNQRALLFSDLVRTICKDLFTIQQEIST